MDGFDAKGVARLPYLHDGILVIPGFLTGRVGKMNHDCVFSRVGDYWSWEHPDLIEDKVVSFSDGQRAGQKSVSLIAAYDGLSWDVVESRCRSGAHRMVKARSFTVEGGKALYTGERIGRSGPSFNSGR